MIACINAMLDCCFYFSGVCFFSIEHETEIEFDNATEQYNSVDSQGKP
jgi:hypothetical protein